ncbi:hypothetical protein [Saccharospirillum impatiens]|uniref:hypothetical protein n=1 Tax=Saccharospirillum impatiens TaxID=169438 RepID=UPI00048DA416|nr:hypothetical protein [Saccharospirillum impatiens]
MTVREIEKPDMSFTEDLWWQKRREALWQQYCEFQYDGVRKSKLKVLEKYFFTGELESPKDHGRGSPGFLGSRIDTFPLRKPEGWDYVIYTFGGYDRLNLEMKQLLENKVLASLTNRGWTLEEELALWDHFLPERYQTIIKSPVFAKRQQSFLEGELHIDVVVMHYSVRVENILDGLAGSSPKYIYRPGYLLSAIEEITPEDISSIKYLDKNLQNLMKLCFRSHDSALPEFKYPIDNFIREFKQNMETLRFDPIVKAIWEDVKREHS